MQFSTTFAVLFLAAATSVAAKKHTQLYCTNASGSGQFIFSFPNDDVTNKVCPTFCSDCTLGDNDGHRVCNSPSKQLDGDGFASACVAAGADGSK
ncbi:hypothetical protein CGCF415_v007349 [Colletotrichum fructicola]|uniref:Uncharacterized protein n=4 Tax=Colletotrichum gloeosporioides species complex TaxID=2707338 RepID=L2FU58_COLFN|nr:uncharacterized protein CGMCC3_g1793 [Colletotrichum fructicola]XP_036495531.1 uncharacterized protein CGCS363_v007538 [Colletotrichum siamense]XP_037178838.1 uncharacterized protein CGCA056_v005994 [Colletotrichum aenigma]XP_045259203.1 uncharacterized protein GCG54_00015421 [Colletotrichum gloeosporioides]EQB56685.1 hypothetical protein CGLO_03305 [Colletotrichum gloeosporioides Cg-14]KAF4483702.1 hypothetical protein CGGC5_v008514 [Colletotrichum fructicola Nara gc5]KAI8205036.1 hypothe